jgi:hypothetical protein
MFDVIYGLLKTAGVAALPNEMRSSVVFDAVEPNAPKSGVRYAAITIENTESQLMTVGPSKRYQVDGALMIHLYEPAGDGEGQQAAIATKIATALTSGRLVKGTTSVRLQSGSVLNTGRSGSSWERLVRVPFSATYYL